MVNNITPGAGQVQGLSSTNRTQETQQLRSEDAPQQGEQRTVIQDEVEISAEALSRLQAEQTATQTGQLLAQQTDLTLGLDPSFGQEQEV